MTPTAAARSGYRPYRPATRQQVRARLEQAREDITRLLAMKYEELAVLHAQLAITAELWEATQPDAAPEFELTPRLGLGRAS